MIIINVLIAKNKWRGCKMAYANREDKAKYMKAYWNKHPDRYEIHKKKCTANQKKLRAEKNKQKED